MDPTAAADVVLGRRPTISTPMPGAKAAVTSASCGFDSRARGRTGSRASLHDNVNVNVNVPKGGTPS